MSQQASSQKKPKLPTPSRKTIVQPSVQMDTNTSQEENVQLSVLNRLPIHPTTTFLRQNNLRQQQLLFGNTYIQRFVMGSFGTVQRAVTLSDEDYTALVEQLHKAMAGWGTDEESIYVALQKLKKDATAVAKLKQVYRDKYKQDLEAEIRDEMSGSELAFALELINIKDDSKKGDIAGGVPGTDEEYKTAARKLHSAMSGWGTDEEAIYGVLLPFNRNKTNLTKLQTVYQSELSGGLTGKGLEEDIKSEMSSNELAYALYLLNAPPPATPGSDVTVVTAGTEAHSGSTEGGNVSVRTGGHFKGGTKDYPKGFSIGYKGGLASESRWLQFIWREIIVDHPTRGQYRVNQSITTSSKKPYNLTTDPDKPNYNTDSASTDDPFYEAGFTDERTADATTIYDHPGAMNNIVNAQFTGGATKVVSRAHFNTYLIRDYRTLYHVYLQVQWEFTTTAEPPRTQTVRSAGKADALPEEMKKRLVEQFPKFEYIQ